MDYQKATKEFCKTFEGKEIRKVTRLFDEGFKGMYVILRILRDSESEVIPSDIAKKMDISTARVAAALNTLSRKNYIQRIPAANGGRRVIVEITPEGRQALAQREIKVNAVITDFFKRLSEDEIQSLISIVKKLFQ